MIIMRKPVSAIQDPQPCQHQCGPDKGKIPGIKSNLIGNAIAAIMIVLALDFSLKLIPTTKGLNLCDSRLDVHDLRRNLITLFSNLNMLQSIEYTPAVNPSDYFNTSILDASFVTIESSLKHAIELCEVNGKPFFPNEQEDIHKQLRNHDKLLIPLEFRNSSTEKAYFVGNVKTNITVEAEPKFYPWSLITKTPNKKKLTIQAVDIDDVLGHLPATYLCMVPIIQDNYVTDQLRAARRSALTKRSDFEIKLSKNLRRMNINTTWKNNLPQFSDHPPNNDPDCLIVSFRTANIPRWEKIKFATRGNVHEVLQKYATIEKTLDNIIEILIKTSEVDRPLFSILRNSKSFTEFLSTLKGTDFASITLIILLSIIVTMFICCCGCLRRARRQVTELRQPGCRSIEENDKLILRTLRH